MFYKKYGKMAPEYFSVKESFVMIFRYTNFSSQCKDGRCFDTHIHLIRLVSFGIGIDSKNILHLIKI